MVTFDYAKLRDNTVLPLLKRFGQTVTLVNRTTGAFDPATGDAEESSTSFSGFGALVDFTDNFRPFSNVEQNDRKLILDAKNVTSEPQIGSEVQTSDGQVLVLKELVSIAPSGIPVAYVCRVGK